MFKGGASRREYLRAEHVDEDGFHICQDPLIHTFQLQSFGESHVHLLGPRALLDLLNEGQCCGLIQQG